MLNILILSDIKNSNRSRPISMLSKEECKQAINKWEKSRHNFEDVKKLIDPSAVFKFTEDNCKWIKENNDNEIFHCYVGVHNNILILIIMPLYKDGKEKIHLNQYITTPLTNLTEEITLIQIDVVTTVSKARLSKNLEIIKKSKDVYFPTFNEPDITLKESLKDIEKWKNECLDWFGYMTSKKSKRKKIFRVFSVPTADLEREDKKDGEIVALFGFKKSSIYKTQLPILIFVTTERETSDRVIIASSNNQELSSTNTKDWSYPVPPYHNKDNFNFL